ncbi:MAG: glycosyltransferase family 4 protein [Candidatus Krumholzibacteriia bacterium]
MKILMVSPYWDPVTGGGERVLKHSALALRDRGHHVDILTLNTDAERRAIWRREDLEWEGMRVVRWPALNLVPRTNTGLNGFLTRVQGRVFPYNYVVKYLYHPGFARLASSYDLIQMHNDIEAGFLWLLRNNPTPRVLWCHTLDVTYRFHYKHHRLTRDILRRSADYFLTGCTSTIAPLREMGIPAQRIGTVHYGVDEKRFCPNPQIKDPKTILFVGALQEHKAALMLIRALRHMERPAHVVLLTISRDAHYGETFQRALEEERARCFHTFEHVPDMHDPPRLLTYYQSATVLATPSLESVFELVNLEALSCGTPVVASRVGGFPDLIRDGENGHLVPPGEPEALARRLDDVLADPERARRLGEEGRRSILRDFTWTRVGEKLEACYENLLRGRHAAKNGAGSGHQT